MFTVVPRGMTKSTMLALHPISFAHSIATCRVHLSFRLLHTDFVNTARWHPGPTIRSAHPYCWCAYNSSLSQEPYFSGCAPSSGWRNRLRMPDFEAEACMPGHIAVLQRCRREHERPHRQGSAAGAGAKCQDKSPRKPPSHLHGPPPGYEPERHRQDHHPEYHQPCTEQTALVTLPAMVHPLLCLTNVCAA